ncbi:MAG: radical SAM protein [Bacteroidales bacterium]
MEGLGNCLLCPRNCGVNRIAGETGYCGCDAGFHVASVCIHQGEEPPIGGSKGICNVFFTGCNLQCLYCQNYQISCRKNRKPDQEYTLEEITRQIIAILDQGIEAVGFVSPTHFTPHVRAIIHELHKSGYAPITVYNSNGYDKVEILKSLEGLIDVYLPDFKYLDPIAARKYSGAKDYPGHAREALREMFRQKGSTVVLNDNGQAVTGLIIRHLVLPGQASDSIGILKWIAKELSPEVSISLMSQYYPTARVARHSQLDRKISAQEYQEVLDAMEALGFHKGWIQDFESSGNYRPDFEKENPFEK